MGADLALRSNARGQLRRSRLVENVGERPPADIRQFAKAGAAAPRGLHELLGNRPAAIMIAAVRKFAANLVQHDIHVGLRALVKFVQFQGSQIATYRSKSPDSPWSLPLFPDDRNRGLVAGVNGRISGGRQRWVPCTS